MIQPVLKPFRDYIILGDVTTAKLLAQKGDLIPALEEAHALFQAIFQLGSPQRPASVFLALNASMVWSSAARMALTGHAVAVYPLLRTALESACYSHLISADSSLEAVWRDRHAGRAARKLARTKFGQPAKDVATAINRIESGAGDVVQAAYDSLIEFGAHPNPFSITPHMQVVSGPEDKPQPGLVGLYSAGSRLLVQAIIACLDVAAIEMRVLTLAPPSSHAAHRPRLDALDDRRQALFEAYQ